MVLSAAAVPINQPGIVGEWVFFMLIGAANVALLMALSVIAFNWPTFLVPPPMRGERGAIQESLHARRPPRPPSSPATLKRDRPPLPVPSAALCSSRR